MPQEGTRLAGTSVRLRTACSSDRARYAWLETQVCLRVPPGRRDRPALINKDAVADFVREALPVGENGAQERLFCIAVDAKNRPVGVTVVAAGSLRGVVVDMRQVFQPVLLLAAYGCFLAHNHPSGDPTPSSDDDAVTRRWIAAARILAVEPIDHVILSSSGESYSYREHGTPLGRVATRPHRVSFGVVAAVAFGRR